MNKKNSPNRRHIADPKFSQPPAFIAVTGYGNEIFHLDTKRVSFHGDSKLIHNCKASTEAPR